MAYHRVNTSSVSVLSTAPVRQPLFPPLPLYLLSLWLPFSQSPPTLLGFCWSHQTWAQCAGSRAHRFHGFGGWRQRGTEEPSLAFDSNTSSSMCYLCGPAGVTETWLLWASVMSISSGGFPKFYRGRRAAPCRFLSPSHLPFVLTPFCSDSLSKALCWFLKLS